MGIQSVFLPKYGHPNASFVDALQTTKIYKKLIVVTLPPNDHFLKTLAGTMTNPRLDLRNKIQHAMITLTASAIKEIKNLLVTKQTHSGEGLRLSVQKGGCAGMQYVMQIELPHAGDETIEQDGAIVHIDPTSAEYLNGCHLIYEYSLSDSGFKVQNPNASRSCGCGTSFEAKGEEGTYDPANDCK